MTVILSAGLKKSRLFLWIILCTALLPLVGKAQLPRNYFRNPLGIPISLSANFGELRPDHWHMGLDMRTNQQENLPVYASAGGYIAHVGVRPQSFGRFIIINHPNGFSTLYGHLNDFFPELEQYIREQQNQKESWAVDLDLSPAQFPVTKGSFIAYSGNTGGSQGPHLHFEIFTTATGKRINPLLFDFAAADNVYPVLSQLALYDRGRSVYEQSPRIYNLKNTDSGYVIPKMPVLETGSRKIGFAIRASDRMVSGGSENGIYSAKLYVDDSLRFAYVLDSIDYEESLYINAHTDYMHKYRGGGWYQQLSRLPGDKAGIYPVLADDGIITLNDTVPHAVRIVVADAAGKSVTLCFMARRNDSLTALIPPREDRFLFAPGQVNALAKPGLEVYLPADALYDTLAPTYLARDNGLPNGLSLLHTVGDPSVPLHEPMIVRIKLNKKVPEAAQDRILMVRTDPKGRTVRKAQWQEDWLAASFPDFGSFQLVFDTIPPQVNAPGPRKKGTDTLNLSAQKSIVFTPADNYGIRKFRAELDGSWLCFTNDKSRNWIYAFDERCPFGTHTLKVTVEDLAGNVTVKEWVFERSYYKPPVKKGPPKSPTRGDFRTLKKKGNKR